MDIEEDAAGEVRPTASRSMAQMHTRSWLVTQAGANSFHKLELDRVNISEQPDSENMIIQ